MNSFSARAGIAILLLLGGFGSGALWKWGDVRVLQAQLDSQGSRCDQELERLRVSGNEAKQTLELRKAVITLYDALGELKNANYGLAADRLATATTSLEGASGSDAAEADPIVVTAIEKLAEIQAKTTAQDKSGIKALKQVIAALSAL